MAQRLIKTTTKKCPRRVTNTFSVNDLTEFVLQFLISRQGSTNQVPIGPLFVFSGLQEALRGINGSVTYDEEMIMSCN